MKPLHTKSSLSSKVDDLAKKGTLALIALGNIAIIGTTLTLGSFYTVSESETVLVFRWGEYLEAKKSGLHWNPPYMDSIKRVDVEKIEEIQFSDTYLTLDENVIETTFNVQFKVNDPYAYAVLVQDPIKQLRRQSESTARAVVADFSMDAAITTERESIRSTIESKLRETLDNDINIGIEIVTINYVGGRPPQAVKPAFDDAIQSREDAETYVNNAEAYREDIIPKAEGEAERVLNAARSYREVVVNKAKGDVSRFSELLPEYQSQPEITKSRIYYDMVENVIIDNTVIITEGTGHKAIAQGSPFQMLNVNEIVAAAQKQSAANAAAKRAASSH